MSRQSNNRYWFVVSALVVGAAASAPAPASAVQAETQPARLTLITAPATLPATAQHAPAVLAPTAPITNVVVTRAASGLLNKPQQFVATVAPASSTLPITFTWSADEQTTRVVSSASLSNTATFTWTLPGTKLITVTANNADLSPVTRVVSVTLSADFHLTILHTDDVHGRLVEYGVGGTTTCVNNPTSDSVCIGGAARASTVINQIRAGAGNVLLLDAGDQFQGTLYYNLFKGEPIAKVMNAMGYQAMGVGNHEFDDGPDELSRFIDLVDFPIVSSNIDASAEPSLTGKIAPSTILTVNGETIGVVGLTTEDTSNISSPGPNVVFTPRVPAIQAAVNGLLAQGIDKVVGLTHIGYEDDIALAQVITGLDVIVGGHSHTFLYTPTTPLRVAPGTGGLDTPAGPYPTVVTAPDGNTVLIVHDFQWGRYLGNLNVTFSSTGTVSAWSGNPIFMTTTIPLDPVITNILTPTYGVPVQQLGTTVVGTSTVDMPNTVGSARICRRVECVLGNFVADAMLWKINSTLPVTEQYQIAIENGGGLRASIDVGPVTYGEVLGVLPFGNTIATFEITGSLIISALENGVSNYPEDGRFPQISGMRFRWDPYRPAQSRIITVEVRNPGGSFSPLNPAARYKVVTNNFNRTGGDFYLMFRDFAINPYDFGPALEQAVIDYLQVFSPVSPTVEGRITYAQQSGIVASPDLAPANGISTTRLTVTIRDAILSPVAGVTVTMLADRGTLSPASATTNLSGQAVFTLTAPRDAGPAMIYAIAGSTILTHVVNFYQDATTVNFSPSVIGQSGPGIVRTDDILTYTVTITNAGPGNASNVVLIATIPDGTEYVEGSVSGGLPPGSLLARQFVRSPLAPTAPVVIWQGDVPAGSSHRLSYAVRVIATEGTIVNNVQVLLDNVPIYTQSASTAIATNIIYMPIVSSESTD